MAKLHRLSNLQIALILHEMSAYYDMQGVDYKKRAYEFAAADIGLLPEAVHEIYAKEGRKGLLRIPNVGDRIARHIEELLKTGRFKEYEKFQKKIPVNLPELLSLEGVGPRTIRELWLRLGIRNIEDLERACRQGAIRKLPRFGIRSERRMLDAIAKRKEEIEAQNQQSAGKN